MNLPPTLSVTDPSYPLILVALVCGTAIYSAFAINTWHALLRCLPAHSPEAYRNSLSTPEGCTRTFHLRLALRATVVIAVPFLLVAFANPANFAG